MFERTDRGVVVLRHVLWFIAIAIASALVGVGGTIGYFAVQGSGPPPKKYWPAQAVNNFSNDDWQYVLARVVGADGYAVQYGRLVDNDDGVRDALYRYVALIAAVSPENRPELFPTDHDKLAYYVNAYNALAMYGVLKRGLPENVAHSLLFWINHYPVGSARMNLDELEKKRVLASGDPRVHFALNCMSYSCPPLRREPYAGARLDEQFDEQGRLFLSNERAARRVDADTVGLSELLTSFYAADFTGAYAKKTGQQKPGLLEALRPFAAPDSPIRSAKDYVTMPYNWSLNRAS